MHMVYLYAKMAGSLKIGSYHTKMGLGALNLGVMCLSGKVGYYGTTQVC